MWKAKDEGQALWKRRLRGGTGTVFVLVSNTKTSPEGSRFLCSGLTLPLCLSRSTHGWRKVPKSDVPRVSQLPAGSKLHTRVYPGSASG